MKNLKIFESLLILILTGMLFSCNSKNSRITEKSGNLASDKEVTADLQDHKDAKRIGMVIKIKPERLQEYLKLHADTNAGIRDLLIKYNMRNFSIYMTRLEDGNYYEFGYYEYWGKDFDSDAAALARDPRNIAWLKTTDPLQMPLTGETSWKMMDKIFFNY